MSTLFTETRNVRQIAMDLGCDVTGLDTYLTLLRAILVKLGGSYQRMDTAPILWRKILVIKGGTFEQEHEYTTIYKLCGIVGADRDVAWSCAKLIQNLVGKLSGGGPTPPVPPVPPVPANNLLDELTNSYSFNEAPAAPENARTEVSTDFVLPSNPGVLDPGPVQGNKAYKFDGTVNSVLQAASAATFQPAANESLTIAFWIVPNKLDDFQWLVTRYLTTVRSFYVLLDETTNKIIAYLTSNGSTWDIGPLTSTTEAEIGVPMHIALVFDSGNEAALWINGVKEDSVVTAVTTINAGPTTKLTLGSRANMDNHYFDGSIDQLDLAKRAWDEDDVLAHRNDGNGLEFPSFEWTDPVYPVTGAWLEENPWTTFSSTGFDNFAGTGVVSAEDNCYVNENFKGSIEALYLEVSFDVDTLTAGDELRFQFAGGNGLGMKPGAAGIGTLTDPVNCSIVSNRVIVSNTGHVSFKAKGISTPFTDIVFQQEGLVVGDFSLAVSNLTWTKE